MSWSSRKKQECIFCNVFFPKGIFLTFLFYLNVKCIEWIFRTYILLHNKKHDFIHFCSLFLTPCYIHPRVFCTKKGAIAGVSCEFYALFQKSYSIEHLQSGISDSDTLAQVFSFEFCKNLKNTFLWNTSRRLLLNKAFGECLVVVKRNLPLWNLKIWSTWKLKKNTWRIVTCVCSMVISWSSSNCAR